MPPRMTGRVIAGRYSLRQPIGRGAMGVVWRGHDELLDREVAVKEVVITSLISDEERQNAYQRTLREARTAARLSHRGVVAVYDVAEEDGRPWIIMELVEARSLDQLLTVEGRLSSLRAGRIGQQLLSALAHAHAAGVLHRDVKPSNVLVARERSGPHGWDERAVLTDFGIAQFEGDPRLTQTGMVMGSPGFTAPERIRGGQASPASDLWSLGATLYTAVEGRGPYDSRGGPITTMSAVIHEDAPVAVHAGRLGPLIAALLRRDPATRPSALAAARLFADVLPLLPEPETDRPGTHPATVRSSYIPAPAEPAASAAAASAAGAASAPAEAAASPAEAVASSAAPPSPAVTPSSAAPPSSAVAGTASDESVADIPARQESADLKDAGKTAAAAGAEAAGAEAAGAEEAGAEEAAAEVAAGAVPEAAPEKAEAAAGVVAEAAPQGAAGEQGLADEEQPEPESESESADRAAADDDGVADEAAVEVAAADGGTADDGGTAEPGAAEPGEEAAAAAGSEAVTGQAADTLAAEDAEGEVSAEQAAKVAAAEPAAAKVAAAAAVGAAADASDDTPAAPVTPPTPVAPSGESSGEQTRIDREPVREQTAVSVPVARSAPSAPPRPKPTFTAASPAERRAAPSFTAATPPAAPPQSAPQSAPHPGYGTPPRAAQPYGGASRPAYGGPGGSGSSGTRPYAASGGGQYAGPSAPHPDLGLQYPPGTGGGKARRSRGLRGRLALLAAAVVVAAGAGAGVALALRPHPPTVSLRPTVAALDDPTTTIPNGWTPVTVPPAKTGTTAGFSIAMPPGWHLTQSGLRYYLNGPDKAFMEIDLTPHANTDMIAEAKSIRNADLNAGKFPRYKEHYLISQPVRGAAGAFWQFTWVPKGGVKFQADDILFIKDTPAGSQSYAIYFRSPNSVWNPTPTTGFIPTFEEMLRTFHTIPEKS